MAKNILAHKILIIDFGSQYTKWIARRVREHNIYSQIVPHDITLREVEAAKPAAIILSGGPSSVFEENALIIDPKILNLPVPIFGICYGLQLLAHNYGGSVEAKEKGEYGFSELSIDSSHDIFSNIPSKINVWMSHMDQVTKLPSGWKVFARSSNEIISAI